MKNFLSVTPSSDFFIHFFFSFLISFTGSSSGAVSISGVVMGVSSSVETRSFSIPGSLSLGGGATGSFIIFAGVSFFRFLVTFLGFNFFRAAGFSGFFMTGFSASGVSLGTSDLAVISSGVSIFLTPSFSISAVSSTAISGISFFSGALVSFSGGSPFSSRTFSDI